MISRLVGGFPSMEQVWPFCNSGGPRSRTRRERLSSNVLGSAKGRLRSPTVRRVGLLFENHDPLATVFRLLELQGLTDPEELRREFVVPAGPLMCRLDGAPVPRRVTGAEPRAVLEDALWLGLATPWLLDPARPVVWTRTSLTRCLEIFEGEGFYA